MKSGIGLLAGVALVACTPEIPDSGTGYNPAPPASAIAQPTPLASAVPPPDAISSEELPPQQGVPGAATGTPAGAATPSEPSFFGADSANVATGTGATVTGASSSNVGTGGDIAAATAAALANSGVPPVQASPSNPPPVDLNNPGISDENDFQAVASRESIASDAERLAQQRAQYEVVTPTAVPQRPTGTDPNIVQYALSAQNPKGTRVYTRTGINLAAKAQRNCAEYASPDQAQTDFLARGGPERDRLGLDPDGDGYACAWDPAPFRAAVNN
ncbi:hypothetical protein ATO3_15720 [Marinibacterium profundimaris]|uniref:Excalibur calcium-binding domain-containing protein n=1 Tax=Marinibacterium profundimaris TaxID=1679460 RepID=A0A225NG32_9RHOB|nr:hypothetical protein ATO3_15720 [Marinibacterium profundimaris]